MQSRGNDRNVNSLKNIMFFLGYSGWEKHQLNNEILNKSWKIDEKSRPSTSIVDLKLGRDRALNTYSKFKKIIADK